MAQDQKHKNPSEQNTAERDGNDDPRLGEPAGPQGYRSGKDNPGHPSSKNPGQANPAHNTPGHERRNQSGQQSQGNPGQARTQSYPGTKGAKARDLQQDKSIDDESVNEVRKDIKTGKQ